MRKAVESMETDDLDSQIAASSGLPPALHHITFLIPIPSLLCGPYPIPSNTSLLSSRSYRPIRPHIFPVLLLVPFAVPFLPLVLPSYPLPRSYPLPWLSPSPLCARIMSPLSVPVPVPSLPPLAVLLRHIGLCSMSHCLRIVLRAHLTSSIFIPLSPNPPCPMALFILISLIFAATALQVGEIKNTVLKLTGGLQYLEAGGGFSN
ncbi:hypothetical protein C8R44DRAFT_895031 [Mycena epipterygia]|nr:hypothetical protein C8R44DRAFT_895031 [Mycena epipterygia]